MPKFQRGARLLYPFPERKAALDAAVELFAIRDPVASPEQVIGYANSFLGWLSGARLVISADPLTYRQGNPAISQSTQFIGGAVQLTDIQQCELSVLPEDSKNQPTSDTLTWSSSDDTVISLQPSEDTLSCLCVAGVPGAGVVVTVTDGTISASDNFDVVPSGVASLVITEGTPEDQPST
jgi:hypothetical protein